MKILQRVFSIVALFVLCVTVVFAQTTGDYRTAASGSWNAAATWQTYNGAAWVAATAAPDTNAAQVSVLAGHTVTVTADVIADSVYVNDGGSLLVNKGVIMTINANNNKPGLVLQGLNALVVSGTLRNEGNIIGANADRNVNFQPAADTAVFKAGSVYNHARNGGTPIVAIWEDSSTYLMTGITANYPNRRSQNFYNFTWNCPNQTRGDGQVNFYRTRVRGDITILSNGTTWGHDRDIRMCDNFPASTTQYTDTVWIDGNIYVRKAPLGQFSRLAISGGGNTNVTAVVIIKGNVVVEDSCVFGRSNSQTDIQVQIGGDLIVSGGGMVFNGAANPYMLKKIVFTKQGTARLSLADGAGAFNRGATVVGPQSWEVASGCTLDVGTSKIDSLDTGFFAISNGGAVKMTYGTNSGYIRPKGESGIMSFERDSLNGALTANGNSFVFANNVVGSGTIAYSASAMQNVSDPGKAVARQWGVTPVGITSADLSFAVSPYDIPTTANFKKFVAMKYGVSGTNWVNRGPVNFIVDDLFGDTLRMKGATLTGVKDLYGTWSIGEASVTKAAVTSPDFAHWPVIRNVREYSVDSIAGFVTPDSMQLKGLVINGSVTVDGIARPRLSRTYPANTTNELDTTWVQWSLSPNGGLQFQWNSLSMLIRGTGTGNMRANVYISKDPTFATRTPVFLSTENLPSAAWVNINIGGIFMTAGPGEKVYVRAYPWLHNQTEQARNFVAVEVTIGGVAGPITSIDPVFPGVVPEAFRVYNAYPNPFNPSTNIRFDLPAALHVTVKVFNMLGQMVNAVISEYKEAGTYTVPFDASGLSSGVYLYRVEAGHFVDVKRIILLK